MSKRNILLMDEPDVHLHPDLQARFAKFLLARLSDLAEPARMTVQIVVATHSSSMVFAFSRSPLTRIGNKYFDNDVVVAKETNDELRKMAPFFGHPLSQIISEEPILIVEGEDDARVLQQAARSSQGKIKVFPCVATSIDEMSALETFCGDVLEAICDDPVGYSLRDGDGAVVALQDVKCIKRYRLICYEMENLLLTDEALAIMGSTWTDFCTKTTAWCIQPPASVAASQIQLLQAIIIAQDRHRNVKIKSVRTLICAILSCNKPWEVVLGQAIAALPVPVPLAFPSTSIVDYMGTPLLKALGLTTATNPAVVVT